MNDRPQTLTLPLLPTRSFVLFPSTIQPIEAGRSFSINAIHAAHLQADSLLFVACQKNPNDDVVDFDSVYHVGSLCRIVSIIEKGDLVRVRVDVVERIVLNEITFDQVNGYYVANATVNNVPMVDDLTNESLSRAIIDKLNNLPNVLSLLNKSTLNQINKVKDATSLCYILASNLQCSTEEKQAILECNNVNDLMSKILLLISGEQTKAQIDENIANSVRESSEKAQKEYFLREKLKAIKKELGENTDGQNSPESILEKLEKNPYPENIKKKVKAELSKFDMMPQGSLEAALIQSYLDVLMNIPWWEKTEDDEDLKHVESILDEDHYGLEEPKKRIVEYLAIKKLTGNLKSPILCFYGPPGTGKTSLGKSIARALGRKFFKASLGGISDEAEIRGHRRTYVGALPGRIIQGMRKAGVTNPVFLLDEVDKLASSYKGDPASALLEVLDPEQNTQFNDNYVEEPYDLSDVLFICTANYLENIPGPLRDRLELIQLSSYTEIEKMHIVKEHLIKKQIALNGLKEDQVVFEDDALRFIIRSYTREAGVRELERKIASCLRKVAVNFVKDPNIGVTTINVDKVKEFLGVPFFEDTQKEKEPQVGVVTGLAYTEYGGDILPIEVNYFKGKGAILTGHLGDVMKESASIALDYVKSNAEEFKVDPDIFANNDIHIHVPEGAVPKDGPSAGVAMTCAIISCLSKRPVSPDVAMTGEVTLRGQALPIGGLREKSLAALRSGIKKIVVPKDNKKDVEELPKEVKETLQIVYMSSVEDAVKESFAN